MNELVPVLSHIRAMVHTDLERVLAWRNNLSVRRFMYTQREITLDEHKRWFDNSLIVPSIHLLIYEYKHQPLGFVKFNETVKCGIVDWGFYTAPEAPKGIGRQLGHTALNHAFSQLKFQKVCAQVLAHNARSIHLHKSLGFQQDGILINQHFEGERFNNVICFGLQSDKWQNKFYETKENYVESPIHHD